MDTSSEYIKMCKKAEEIQVHKFQEGDYYYADDWEFGHPLLEGQTFLAFDSDNWDGDVSYITRCNKRTVWLPRQDQLQEMVVSEETEPALIIIDKLAHFAMWVKYQCHKAYTSMEQLCLAYIMKEKFGKDWDGKNWNLEKVAKKAGIPS